MLWILLLGTALAGAGTPEPDSGGLEDQDNTVVVTATREKGYGVEDSGMATRTDTLLAEAPAAVPIVPRDLITDRVSQTAADALALALAPPINQRQSDQGHQAFTIRGFFQDGDNRYLGAAPSVTARLGGSTTGRAALLYVAASATCPAATASTACSRGVPGPGTRAWARA